MGSHLIEGYRNVPGEHCGSTAMRNLLQHYCGLELTEDEVFGLGSGLDFVLLETELFAPGILMFGRGPTMEIDVTDALAVNYQEQIELDDERAWKVVKEEVLAERPTMLSGDVLYLDYREFKVHFPAHRYVLLGFDDDAETAWIADRLDREPQPCSYEGLRKSRNPQDFISTLNTWGKFYGTEVGRSLPEAFEHAIGKTVSRMRGESTGHTQMFELVAGGKPFKLATGLAGLERLRDMIPEWAVSEHAPQSARYAAECIEAFGTGGGNFRNLYAGFLRSAHARVPQLVGVSTHQIATHAAELWTRLSKAFGELAKSPESFDVAATQALVDSIIGSESRLIDTLAGSSGG